MENPEIKAKSREGTGKEVARKLRREGFIPAILYGGDLQAQPIIVNAKSLQLAISRTRENALFLLNLEGESRQDRHVLLRELQVHPVRRTLLHADLYEVSMDKKIVVEIPIRVVGEAVSVSEKKGVLTLLLKELSVECLPGWIPEEIEVDVSGLDVGNVLHVKDLKVGEGIRVLNEPEEPVVTASIIAEEEVKKSAEEEGPTEPVVVGKGSKATEEKR